jgi:HD superfamily phosphodiesterase
MIGKVAGFVHSFLLETGKTYQDEPWGPTYRWEHTLRVAHWAWILAREEKVEVEKSVAAALFHDVSHFVSKDYRQHGEKSGEIALAFMLKAGFPSEFAAEVAYAVRSHVGERKPRTIHAKILQDADALDRFGHFRLLLFGKTVDLSNLEEVKAEIRSKLEYFEKVERGDFGPLWTKTGKRRVGEFIRVSKVLYDEVLSEIESTVDPEAYV